jgi:hypothetical protein
MGLGISAMEKAIAGESSDVTDDLKSAERSEYGPETILSRSSRFGVAYVRHHTKIGY